jgi:hypothetical protein
MLSFLYTALWFVSYSWNASTDHTLDQYEGVLTFTNLVCEVTGEEGQCFDVRRETSGGVGTYQFSLEDKSPLFKTRGGSASVRWITTNTKVKKMTTSGRFASYPSSRVVT